MKVYITRILGSEYDISDIYEEALHMEKEVDISAEDFQKWSKCQLDYWAWQDKWDDLYRTGKVLESPRRDKEEG